MYIYMASGQIQSLSRLQPPGGHDKSATTGGTTTHHYQQGALGVQTPRRGDQHQRQQHQQQQSLLQLKHPQPDTDNKSTASATSIISNSTTSLGRTTPVYVPPNEFRMKLLKRILSVDGNIDKKALQRLQRHSSDRSLQANILFENGDMGTLISFDTLPEENLFKDRPDSDRSSTDTTNSSTLPRLQKPSSVATRSEDGMSGAGAETDQRSTSVGDRTAKKKERPLRLPPIILPPVYSLQPRPLIVRDFSGPPYVPPEATEEEWDALQDCRYLRPALMKYKAEDRNKLVL